MDGINIAQIAKDIAPLLIPLLPYLSKGLKLAGEGFAKSIGTKTGEKIPDVIEKMWTRIEPKIEETPGAIQTVQNVIERQDDVRVKGSFELLLEDILQDKVLQNELIPLLQEAKDQGVTIESVIKIRELYGNVLGVDIQNGTDLKNNIRTEIDIEKAQEGSSTTAVRISNNKSLDRRKKTKKQINKKR